MYLAKIKPKRFLFYLAATVLFSSVLAPMLSLAAPSPPTNLVVSGDATKPTLTWDAAEGEPNGANWTEETADAGWSGRAYHASTVFDNKMWVIGGENASSDAWYSEDGVNWTQATADGGWGARTGHAAIGFNGKLWIFGGGSSGNDNEIWSSVDGEAWVKESDAADWGRRWGHTVVTFDDKLWLIGGNAGGTRKNDVWYSEDGVGWTQATAGADWQGRYQHSSVVFDGKMWILGGFNGDVTNDVWYSEDGSTWIEATSNAAWPARDASVAAVHDNKIWMIGGEVDGGAQYVLDDGVWYSEDGVTWTEVAVVSGFGDRGYYGGTTFEDKIWLLGGYHTVDWNHASDVWSTPNLSVTDYKICWDTVQGGCSNSEIVSADDLIALAPAEGYGGFWSNLVASVSNFFMPKASAQGSSLSYTFTTSLGPGSWYFSIFALNGAGTSSASALTTSFSVVPGLPNTGTERRNNYILPVALAAGLLLVVAWRKRFAFVKA